MIESCYGWGKLVITKHVPVTDQTAHLLRELSSWQNDRLQCGRVVMQKHDFEMGFGLT
jgi:hypothetical protein